MEKRRNQIRVYLGGVDTSDSVSLPLADARSAFKAAVYIEDFRATTSAYDSAVASGDISLVSNLDFRRAMSDFTRSQLILDLISRTFTDILFIGPGWEILRKVGDYRILFLEPSALLDSSPISKRFEMNESDLRDFFLQRETVAMMSYMEIVQDNHLDYLEDLRTSTLEAISALETK